MTSDDIIDMACSAKLGRRMRPIDGWPTGDVFYTDNSYRTAELEDFARAVAAAEREAIGAIIKTGIARELDAAEIQRLERSEWTETLCRAKGAVLADILRKIEERAQP